MVFPLQVFIGDWSSWIIEVGSIEPIFKVEFLFTLIGCDMFLEKEMLAENSNIRIASTCLICEIRVLDSF